MHIDIRQWLSDLVRAPPGDRTYAALNAVRGLHNGLFYTVSSRYPLGTNIFEREWDLLVVLDACRVDAMEAVAPEYDFIESVDSIWSTGSSSHEWLCKTFTGDHIDEIRETIYLSSNPNAPPTFEDGVRPPRSYAIPLMWANWDVVDRNAFKLFKQIPKPDYEERYATLAPDVVTDHSIHAGRTHEFGRMVVHYFQPHRPYIADAHPEKRAVNDIEDQPWEAIRNGIATKGEVWDLYLDNLRLALDSVERLLANIDAERVVITADHGDLFGEFGMYGHPEGFLHPNLKKVPWVETTATDEKTSTPTIESEREESKRDVEKQLEELGYI